MEEYEGYFDNKKDVAFIVVDKRIDEDVVETTMVEFLFEDFISNKFDDEISISQALITKSFQKDPNEIKYKDLLKTFIENYDKLKDYPHYPESELLPEALTSIVKHAMQLYSMVPTDRLKRQVENIIRGEEALTGKTGYNLKLQFKSKIAALNRDLISAKLIANKTTVVQWQQFFAEKYPSPEINWIVEKAENHIWYFINKIEESDILIDFPDQQWKYLPNSFTANGKKLSPKFYSNHNYLNRKQKDIINIIFINLLS
ncbi:hypothetical protein [Maribellus mangrovi]|uniref:hypothetical protein n=1 Tax=Maribellus mangrovi TaxID=3133146 RepID=UPI0030EC88B8